MYANLLMVVSASQESAVFVVCWVRAIVRILSIGASPDRFFYLMAKRYDEFYGMDIVVRGGATQ
jgi:hypothetical protein